MGAQSAVGSWQSAVGIWQSVVSRTEGRRIREVDLWILCAQLALKSARATAVATKPIANMKQWSKDAG